MLKQAATVEDRLTAKPPKIDGERNIACERENHEEFDFENRWTPVAFTLALDDADNEV